LWRPEVKIPQKYKMHCHLAILATYYPIMAAQIIFSSTLASPSLPAVTGFYQPPMEYKVSLLLYDQAAPSYASLDVW